MKGSRSLRGIQCPTCIQRGQSLRMTSGSPSQSLSIQTTPYGGSTGGALRYDWRLSFGSDQMGVCRVINAVYTEEDFFFVHIDASPQYRTQVCLGLLSFLSQGGGVSFFAARLCMILSQSSIEHAACLFAGADPICHAGPHTPRRQPTHLVRVVAPRSGRRVALACREICAIVIAR